MQNSNTSLSDPESSAQSQVGELRNIRSAGWERDACLFATDEANAVVVVAKSITLLAALLDMNVAQPPNNANRIWLLVKRFTHRPHVLKDVPLIEHLLSLYFCWKNPVPTVLSGHHFYSEKRRKRR